MGLYVNRNEFDAACSVMIEHSVEAWEHGMFKDIIPKVASAEICYRAVQFYLEEHPTMVNDILNVLIPRVDHTRVISLVRKIGHLPLIKPYLLSIQRENIGAVNNAINELYIEEEDHDSLRSSLDNYDNVDTLELANRLESHDLLEFRRIAASLYKQNNKWQKSIALSKKDEKWKDVIATAAASRNEELVNNILQFFVEEGRKDCFAACLYTCYDLVTPDVVMELAWKHGMMDFAMPFFIQSMRNMNLRLKEVESRVLPSSGVQEQNMEEFHSAPGNNTQNFGTMPPGMMPGQFPPQNPGMGGSFASPMPQGGAYASAMPQQQPATQQPNMWNPQGQMNQDQFGSF